MSSLESLSKFMSPSPAHRYQHTGKRDFKNKGDYSSNTNQYTYCLINWNIFLLMNKRECLINNISTFCIFENDRVFFFSLILIEIYSIIYIFPFCQTISQDKTRFSFRYSKCYISITIIIFSTLVNSISLFL